LIIDPAQGLHILKSGPEAVSQVDKPLVTHGQCDARPTVTFLSDIGAASYGTIYLMTSKYYIIIILT